MRTLYYLRWGHRTYVSTNGMKMLDFANWLGATEPVSIVNNTEYYIPEIETI